MELSNIYIDDNILFNIFRQLPLLDMVRFSHVNRLTYNIFYKLIKNKIYKISDYKNFYRLINMYKYNENEITKLGISSIMSIKTIISSENIKYYDLRYLFELINNGFNSKDNYYKYSDNYEVLKMMIMTIKRCISFNRFETILKVSSEPILYSLRKNINIKQPKDFTPIIL